MEEYSSYRHDFVTIGSPAANATLSDLGHDGREIRIVKRDDPLIERFVTDIPALCSLHATCGLVWDERLRPCNGKYEPNMHYFPTGQQAKKSAHGLIEFYRDGRSGAVFAVKSLQEKDSFHHEEIYSRLKLQHQNIADVYGIVVRSGMVQILMEYAGTALVKERHWFAESPERMCQLAKQCFRALCFLHVRDYVHCDIKPDNLMVVRKDDSFTLKVIDFGTCCRIKQPLPSHAHTTWQYWPPEMWKAWEKKETFLAEASMDVYAMALTLYFVQKGSHLMLNMPQEVMTKRPEYVKMMALPESIPVDLRFVMNHCLEVNKVSRFTAEEAGSRLEDSEPNNCCDGNSSTEEYFANLNSVARADGRKKSIVDNWIEKSNTKPNTLHGAGGRNRSSAQREIIVGPEAARFKRKTSIIFQQLKRISDSSNAVIDKCGGRTQPVGESRLENSEELTTFASFHTMVKKSEANKKTDQKATYPCLSLLEKLFTEHGKHPSFSSQDMSDHCPAQKQAKVAVSFSPHEMTQMTSKVGKTKASSGLARMKNRAKLRQKNYDRSQCSARKSAASSDKTFGKVEKLWPTSAAPNTSFEKGDDYKLAENLNEDDMDFLFDAISPEAFKSRNENNVADFMFAMLQRQESEEGSESIRVDMDGMSLSSPDVAERGRAVTVNEEMDQTGACQIRQVEMKEKPAKDDSVSPGLPNFELIS